MTFRSLFVLVILPLLVSTKVDQQQEGGLCDPSEGRSNRFDFLKRDAEVLSKKISDFAEDWNSLIQLGLSLQAAYKDGVKEKALELRLLNIEWQLGNLTIKVDGLSNGTDDLSNKTDDLSIKTDDLSMKTDDLKKEVGSLQRKVSVLESQFDGNQINRGRISTFTITQPTTTKPVIHTEQTTLSYDCSHVCVLSYDAAASQRAAIKECCSNRYGFGYAWCDKDISRCSPDNLYDPQKGANERSIKDCDRSCSQHLRGFANNLLPSREADRAAQECCYAHNYNSGHCKLHARQSL